MSEKPPKPLSRGEQRKVARTHVKEAGLHKHVVDALKEAKRAEDRAEYVKRDELRRFVFGTRGKKYDEKVYGDAPVDEVVDVPETGSKRRKAVREYSKLHDVPGQIRREQERLKRGIKQVKRLETGPLTRAVFGTRSREYETGLYEGETTKKGIQEALERAKEEKLSFRTPSARKVIDVTPSTYEDEEEPPYTKSDMREGAEEVDRENALLTEQDMEAEVAKAELRGFADVVERARGPMGVVIMTEREMEEAVGEAEFEQFRREVARKGRRVAGKATPWRRLRALLSVLGAGVLAWLGGTQAVDLVEAQNRQPSVTDVDVPPEPLTVRDSEEVFGTYDGPAFDDQREYTEEELRGPLPQGFVPSPDLAQARVDAALEHGVAPDDARSPQEP